MGVFIKIYKPDGESDGEADGRAAAPTIPPPDPEGAHNENPSLVALGKKVSPAFHPVAERRNGEDMAPAWGDPKNKWSSTNAAVESQDPMSRRRDPPTFNMGGWVSS